MIINSLLHLTQIQRHTRPLAKLRQKERNQERTQVSNKKEVFFIQNKKVV